MEDEKKHGLNRIRNLQQPDKDAREKGMTLKEWEDGLRKLEEEIIQKLNHLETSLKEGKISNETYEAKREELYLAIGEINESHKRLKQAYDSHLKIRTNN